MNKILRIKGFQAMQSKVPVETSKATANLPYIAFFGNQNDFPQRIVDKYEASSIHKTAILTKLDYTVGMGLMVHTPEGTLYEGGDVNMDRIISNPNDFGDTLQSLFKQAALDQLLYGGHSMQVFNPNKTAETLAFNRLEFGGLRYKKNGTDLPNKFYEASSQEWIEAKGKTKIDFKELPVYSEGNGVIYSADISPLRSYYPLPDYYTLAFNAWAEIEYKIPVFNVNRIDNKFMPSGILSLIGSPPQGQTVDKYMRQFLQSFTGEGNNSKLIAQMVDEHTQAPVYTQIDDTPDGIFTELDKLTVDNVLLAHRTHPMLLNKTAGSMGNSSEWRSIFEVYMNSVIYGYQQTLLATFNKILKDAGLNYTLSVSNIMPVSFAGDLDVNQVLTRNEQREVLGYSNNIDTITKEQMDVLIGLIEKVNLGMTRDKAIKLAELYGIDPVKAIEVL